MFTTQYKLDRMIQEAEEKVLDKYNRLIRENEQESFKKVKDAQRQLDREQFAHEQTREYQKLALIKETAKLEETIVKLSADKTVLEKECAMLRTAFENMGFDVVDVKEMMESLVKALSVKNTVQMITPSSNK